MAFGAKTIAALVKELSETPSLDVLDATNNASVRMRSAEALQQLIVPLKTHKAIKRLVLADCEITDAGCEALAELLRVNNIIEELVLEKNKIGSAGAIILADALAHNRGLRTLNLLQQSTKNFGEETLERFVQMFNDNITLTKITWRLESRKSFLLNKLQTRNVEIKKRKDKGEDFNAYLPDHMKAEASAASADTTVAGGYEVADAPAIPVDAPAAPPAATPEVILTGEGVAAVPVSEPVTNAGESSLAPNLTQVPCAA